MRIELGLLCCLIATTIAARIIEPIAKNDPVVRQESESTSADILDANAGSVIENEISNDDNAPIESVVDTVQQDQVPQVVDTQPVNENDPDPINRYCSCTRSACKCCREFSIPIVAIKGPGCATIRYLEEDRMAVTVKYGDIVLASRTVSGRKATPICLPLPGGFNQFCGRVYGISRKGENFKACLGLDLRAEDEVEAALRVSCFNFGPKGVSVGEAEPLPAVPSDEDDDDDDDDDVLGLGGGDDDDDDGGDDDDDDDDDGPDGGVVGDLLSIVT